MDKRPDYQENKIRVVNRKVIIFAGCLLLSFLFWLLNALSKDYTTTLQFPTKFINYKHTKIVNKLPERLSVTLKATGYKLLQVKLLGLKDSASIDIHKNIGIAGDKVFYSTNQNFDKIKLGSFSSSKIYAIIPDTIFLSTTQAIIKKVPVKPKVLYTLETEYKLIDSILTIPNSIEISGPQEIVDKIEEVETEPIQLGLIKDSIIQSARLNYKPGWKNLINTDPSQVQIKLKTEKFTEKRLEIPIVVENVPAPIGIRIFPATATVKFLVSQKNYESVTPENFKVVADYTKSKTTGINKIKLEVVKYPSIIQRLVLSPEKVEFILKK